MCVGEEVGLLREMIWSSVLDDSGLMKGRDGETSRRNAGGLDREWEELVVELEKLVVEREVEGFWRLELDGQVVVEIPLEELW